MHILALISLAMVAAPAAATEFSVVHMAAVDNVRYLHVDSGGSMDVLKLTCSSGAVSSAAIYAPRDAATGQASGKRMHKPFTIVKEWGPPPPMSASVKPSWNVKSIKTARMAGGGISAMDDWQEVSVSGISSACDAPFGKVSVSDLSITK